MTAPLLKPATGVEAADVLVVGLGYIGLPTAAVIAGSGLIVRGIDISPQVVNTVNEGRVHIEETNLAEVVRDAVGNGKLSASLAPCQADVFLIAVPTPFGPGHAPDTSYVMAAVRKIAPVLQSGNCVILESTSPIGTTHEVAALLAQLRPDLSIPGECADRTPDLAIAYCPERVLPGRIVVELIENDRVVGGITRACAERAGAFYRRFVRGECVETTARAAEMVKLVENSFRDVNIAFANELSIVAEELGIDIWEVIRLANRHPRVNILQPGPGVGGHCIAVDPWFLIASAPKKARLIRTAREVNDGKSGHVADRAKAMLAALPEARVACLGLAFKPNIDDFRESPALEIVRRLATGHGPRLRIVEPYAARLPDDLAEHGAEQATLDEALAECEIVLVLVDHDAFRNVDPAKLAGKVLYDTRGMWSQLRALEAPAA
jgi:UDP-N-acetyl-D-mannosaminuronic acid dehydrogenase